MPEVATAPDASEDRASRAEPAARPHEGSKEPRAAVRARQPTRASRPPTETPTAPPAPAPNGASSSELAEARRRAAAEVIEDAAQADARRSFAFPGTIAQQRAFDESERIRRREHGLQPPATVFDSPAKGRAALREEAPGPFGVQWISDDCYAFREPTDRFVVMGMLIPPIPATTCTRRLARADLFVTAKPSYLMGADERAAVEAETQRRERLRRPTTGAVMPPAKD